MPQDYAASSFTSGDGAGAIEILPGTHSSTATSAATCFNPLDVTCWLQNAAQWLAQQIMNALQPVINALLSSPLNILTQTLPADTYTNPTVISWWQAFLAVVDLAVACLVVIGGYNVMVGRSPFSFSIPTFGQRSVLSVQLQLRSQAEPDRSRRQAE